MSEEQKQCECDCCRQKEYIYKHINALYEKISELEKTPVLIACDVIERLDKLENDNIYLKSLINDLYDELTKITTV